MKISEASHIASCMESSLTNCPGVDSEYDSIPCTWSSSKGKFESKNADVSL